MSVLKMLENFFLPCYDLENIFAILELGKCSICFPQTKFVINIFFKTQQRIKSHILAVSPLKSL